MNNQLTYFGVCPITTAQQIIGGKWKILILSQLAKGPIRFSELQRSIPDITQGMLTTQLRSLEKDKLINRKVYPEVPPKVEYSLTTIGEAFLPVLDSIKEWGTFYMDTLK